MAAAAAEEAEEEAQAVVDGKSSTAAAAEALLADPALASIRDVPLPPGVADSDGEEEDVAPGMDGGNLFYADPSADPHMAGQGGAGAAPGGAGWAGAGLEEDDAEDAEDYIAKGTDAFLVVASTEEDFSSLEVYVYNEEDGAFFVHHDVPLPAFPLALAWSDCAPVPVGPEAAVSRDPVSAPVGSFMAVGTFKPGIEVWSLDTVDPLEPAVTLGGMAPGPKAALLPGSHTDAVMGLSWNAPYRNLLASSSADCTVKVWDLLKGTALHTFTKHKGKVQAVAWHPAEAGILASGGYDRALIVADARNPTGAVASMALPGDVEALAWSPHSASHIAVSTDAGAVLAFDVRAPAKGPLVTLAAHKGACTSLSFAPRVQGLLATAGEDEVVKLWDLGATGEDGAPAPAVVSSKTMDIGHIFTAGFFPHSPWLLAAGGSKGKVAIWDIASDAPTVPKRFTAGAAAVPGASGRVLPVHAVPSLAVRPRDDAQAHEGHALSQGTAAAAAPSRRGADGAFAQREVDAVLESQAAAAAAAKALEQPKSGGRKRGKRGGRKKKSRPGKQ